MAKNNSYLVVSDGHAPEYWDGEKYLKLEPKKPVEVNFVQAKTLLNCYGVSLYNSDQLVDFEESPEEAKEDTSPAEPKEGGEQDTPPEDSNKEPEKQPESENKGILGAALDAVNKLNSKVTNK